MIDPKDLNNLMDAQDAIIKITDNKLNIYKEIIKILAKIALSDKIPYHQKESMVKICLETINDK